jgi:hypothetical protein
MSSTKEFPVMTKVAIAFLLLACAAAWAADTVPLAVKTGQWESTSTSETSGTPPIPPEALAQMPPERRAKMEERMKAMGAPRTTTTKNCVTKEQIDKAFDMGQQKSCTRTVVSSSASKQEVRVDCSTDKIKSTGVFRVEAVNSETVKGSMQMTMNSGGRPMNMNSTFTAKWLGPTCDSKP